MLATTIFGVCRIFADEMRPIIEKQNPSLGPKEIEHRLYEMWEKLSEEEQIPYYVKSMAAYDARKVFDAEKEKILTEKMKLANYRVNVFNDDLWNIVSENERKPYIDKATMSLTQEEVMKRMPGIYHPYNIIFEGKPNAKEIECLKRIEPLALKALNDEKVKVTKEQEKEKIKNELFDHIEKLKQKEQELLTREKHINIREKELILKVKQFNEREEELNIKEAILIKMEEYFNNLFLL